MPFGEVPLPETEAEALKREDAEADEQALASADFLADPVPEPTPFAGHLPAPSQTGRLKLTHHVACDPQCPVPKLDAQHPAPVALWSQELDEVPQRFARDLRVDVYGLVIHGNAILYDRSFGTSNEIETWQAFHAPGGGISVAASKPRPRLVFAVVSDALPIRQIQSRPVQPWALRPATLEIVDLGGVEDLSWADGKVHARIGFESGRASFGLMLTSADAPMAAHAHPGSWEVMGLLSADGELRTGTVLRPAELGPPVRLVDGDVAAVPKGVNHRWIPGGERPLLGVQLYVPPGPEQRFKDLAAGR